MLRDHNDVIEFNSCNKDLTFQNDHPTPLKFKVRSPHKCLRPGISVRKRSNGGNDEYKVDTSSLLSIAISREKIYLQHYTMKLLFLTLTFFNGIQQILQFDWFRDRAEFSHTSRSRRSESSIYFQERISGNRHSLDYLSTPAHLFPFK